MQNEEIGEKIKILRTERKLTQKDVAYLAKISLVAYSNIERGISFPKQDTLKAIAEVFKVNPNDIWQRNDELKAIRFRASSKLLIRGRILQDTETWLNNRKHLDSILSLDNNKSNCFKCICSGFKEA